MKKLLLKIKNSSRRGFTVAEVAVALAVIVIISGATLVFVASQAKVEARIKELEELIQNAEINNDDDMDESVVGLGSFVKVVKNGVEVEYSIVGSNEANPFENKISDMSPVGKALIGKRAGDEIEVRTNAGAVTLKVLEVSRIK